MLTGCTVVIAHGPDTRDYFVLGFARLRLPAELGDANARAVEISGIGVAVSNYVQFGYFKEFQASLKPDSNSVVILVRSDAEARQLDTLLKQLNQNGLCLILKDQRS